MRRNNFPDEQIPQWFLLLSENLSASYYPGAALTVGLRGQYSNGLRWQLRIARARSATVLCMFATTGIMLSGRSKGRPRWSTVWCAVQTPRARVGGAPSAPKLNVI